MKQQNYKQRLNRELIAGIVFCILGIILLITSLFIIINPKGELNNIILLFNYVAVLIILSLLFILIGILILRNWDKKNKYYMLHNIKSPKHNDR